MDLKKLGITDYGELGTGQLGDCANNKLELFFPDRVRILTKEIIIQLTHVSPSPFLSQISILFDKLGMRLTLPMQVTEPCSQALRREVVNRPTPGIKPA